MKFHVCMWVCLCVEILHHKYFLNSWVWTLHTVADALSSQSKNRVKNCCKMAKCLKNFINRCQPIMKIIFSGQYYMQSGYYSCNKLKVLKIRKTYSEFIIKQKQCFCMEFLYVWLQIHFFVTYTYITDAEMANTPFQIYEMIS